MSKKASNRAENKSELIAFRTTPRGKFGLELICRTHGMSQTAAIAYALRQLMDNPQHGLALGSGGHISLKELQSRTYSADPVIRFLKLAQNFPELLTEHELDAWNAITSNNSQYTTPTGDWKIEAVKKALDEAS